MFVPVKSKDGEKLMPTTPARARKWMKSGKATPYWNNGIFCVRLNIEPSGRHKQEIAVGVDPGSKKEGFHGEVYFTHISECAGGCTHSHCEEGQESQRIKAR